MDNDDPTSTISPADLHFERFNGDHPADDTCQFCGERIRNVALVDLVYFFDRCDCDHADYRHLVERAAHLSCMAEGGAVDFTTRNMLEDAAYVTGKYKKGQQTAAEIRAFLDKTKRAATEET